MAVHGGGKVGKAGKILASKSSSKFAKSKAAKILDVHKAKKHQSIVWYFATLEDCKNLHILIDFSVRRFLFVLEHQFDSKTTVNLN